MSTNLFFKKLDFKNKKDIEQFKFFYDTVLLENFQDKNEVETFENFLIQANRFLEVNLDFSVVLVFDNRAAIAGLIADVFNESGIIEYIVVD